MASQNPIRFENEKVENLNEAKKIFLNAIDEYLTRHPDKYSEIRSLKVEIEKAYLDKKATYLLEDKFEDFERFLQKSFRFAMSNSKELGKDSSSLYYLKHSKRFAISG